MSSRSHGCSLVRTLWLLRQSIKAILAFLPAFNVLHHLPESLHRSKSELPIVDQKTNGRIADIVGVKQQFQSRGYANIVGKYRVHLVVTSVIVGSRQLLGQWYNAS